AHLYSNYFQSLLTGTHLRLRPANNTVYNDVCVAQYYADSPVLPVEFFGRLYQIPLLRVAYNYYRKSIHAIIIVSYLTRIQLEEQENRRKLRVADVFQTKITEVVLSLRIL
ncbi:hypothetical protein L9F63_006118, partial [Diploptera punctata]